MTRAEKLAKIAENEQKVFDSGKQAEYDAFWDDYQQNGNRRAYAQTFAGTGWTDLTYNPKYEVIATTQASSVYSYNTKITTTKVPITIDVASASNVFQGCTKLATIPLLTVTERTPFTAWFGSCPALANITFGEGSVIGKSIDFKSCPLTLESAKSVILHLKDLRDVNDYAYSCLFHADTWALLDADVGINVGTDTTPSYSPWRDYVEYNICWNI